MTDRHLKGARLWSWETLIGECLWLLSVVKPHSADHLRA